MKMKKMGNFRTNWAEWNANGPVWMPQALKSICTIQFWSWVNSPFPLFAQSPWEEIKIQVMEGSFFMELQVISGRVWCSVYKSLTGWLLARGHVGRMDVWRRNEGSAGGGRGGESRADFEVSSSFGEVNTACLPHPSSQQGRKIGWITLLKIASGWIRGERSLAWRTMRWQTDHRVKEPSPICHPIFTSPCKTTSVSNSNAIDFPRCRVATRVGPPVPVSCVRVRVPSWSILVTVYYINCSFDTNVQISIFDTIFYVTLY